MAHLKVSRQRTEDDLKKPEEEVKITKAKTPG